MPGRESENDQVDLQEFTIVGISVLQMRVRLWSLRISTDYQVATALIDRNYSEQVLITSRRTW